jgi:hypothetical protein
MPSLAMWGPEDSESFQCLEAAARCVQTGPSRRVLFLRLFFALFWVWVCICRLHHHRSLWGFPRAVRVAGSVL